MYDYIIIGGGIIGTSTAWQLQQKKPKASILLLEKENELAQHQTGRNSGVIHSGIYYKPGSLKAKFCKKGVEETISFCKKHNVSFDQCGKLIVATNPLEYKRLLEIYKRAHENGLKVELLDKKMLKDKEPNIEGSGAIFINTTGIVDYSGMTQKMADIFSSLGGETRKNSKVTKINEVKNKVDITLADGTIFETSYLIVCAGLMADRLAIMQGLDINFRVIPYRGEYYQLSSDKNKIVNHLIYPVPDPKIPFLGIHLTKMIDGSITVGPNALQGYKREGYGKLNFNLIDTLEMILFTGFWKVLQKNFKSGLVELWNSIWKRGYLKQINKYCPSITLKDLKPYQTGVRAMTVDRNGELIDDFLIINTHRSLHVCNAPSPAATSAIPIGNHICDKVLSN
ncbi:MAG: L-2-hydroxyglutarate oxidase [Woeseia sp.]|nr:L-2-hydroxyglutarate oxidase [Woeseia sp.]